MGYELAQHCTDPAEVSLPKYRASRPEKK